MVIISIRDVFKAGVHSTSVFSRLSEVMCLGFARLCLSKAENDPGGKIGLDFGNTFV